MAKLHAVTLNGQPFSARSGQVLLDAALMSGVDLPHDCRAGRCGSCLTRVRRGLTLGGEALQPGMVHACQARVFSDLELAVEPLPAVAMTPARLVKVVDVTHDVAELTIIPDKPLTILPGQYCRFAFRGFPERCFSPTAPLDGRSRGTRVHLNVKRVRNGRVSTNLGGKIGPGHRLSITGPFGHAFLRPRQTNRLVLVAGGTGFAPMWAIGEAALRENPRRPIVFVAGARELRSLYMANALAFVRQFPNVGVIVTAEEEQTAFPHVRLGRPSDHVPALDNGDIVYAAGAPAMVEAVGARAQAAHATFHADPFEAAAIEGGDWVTKAASWLGVG
jgi:CDP-4-dehydro-6-deoxyglucose reductase, E3